MSPSFCTINIKCDRVEGPVADKVPCQELDSNDQLTFNFSPNDYLTGTAPGTYKFYFELTTGAGSVLNDLGGAVPDIAGVTAEMTFDLVLLDPCVTANIVSVTGAT